MKTKLTSLLTALLAFAAVGAFAQPDSKPAAKEEGREKFKNLTPAEREAKAKEWRDKNGDRTRGGNDGERMQKAIKELGLDPEELKKLPPEERRAKFAEASKKKTEELKKKQTDGTITEDEKKLLERMEQRRKFMEENRGKGGERPHRDGTEKGEKKDKDARVPEVQTPDKK